MQIVIIKDPREHFWSFKLFKHKKDSVCSRHNRKSILDCKTLFAGSSDAGGIRTRSLKRVSKRQGRLRRDAKKVWITLTRTALHTFRIWKKKRLFCSLKSIPSTVKDNSQLFTSWSLAYHRLPSLADSSLATLLIDFPPAVGHESLLIA